MAKHSVTDTPVASTGPLNQGDRAPDGAPRRNVKPGRVGLAAGLATALAAGLGGQPPEPQVSGEPAKPGDKADAADREAAEAIVDAVAPSPHGANCSGCAEHIDAIRGAALELVHAVRQYVEHRYGAAASQPLALVAMGLAPGAREKLRAAATAAAKGNLFAALMALK